MMNAVRVKEVLLPITNKNQNQVDEIFEMLDFIRFIARPEEFKSDRFKQYKLMTPSGAARKWLKENNYEK